MSKNKSKKQKPEIQVSDDVLLGGPTKPEVKEEKPKQFVGYHPVTGEELYR